MGFFTFCFCVVVRINKINVGCIYAWSVIGKRTEWSYPQIFDSAKKPASWEQVPEILQERVFGSIGPIWPFWQGVWCLKL
jgi:hypothetical protein